MKMSNMCFFSLFLVYLTFSINSADYIWIDYSVQGPITATSNHQYKANIPCKVKFVAQCQYKYTTLPLGWSSLKDGTLIIPQNDATKDGVYTIEGELTQKSGQTLVAKLAIQISKQIFKVTDLAEYYKKNNYNPNDNKNHSSYYKTSPMVKDVPDGFPSLKSIQDTINNGDSAKIKQLVQQITQNYAPCRSKINYLTSVKTTFKNSMQKKENSINSVSKQIEKLNNQLTNLKFQKQNQLSKKGVDQDIINLYKKIQETSKQFQNYNSVGIYYKELANQTLEQYKIQLSKPVVQTKQSKKLKQLQNTEIRWNKWLIRAVKNRLSIQNGLYSLNFSKQMKNIEKDPIVSYVFPPYESVVDQLLQQQAKNIQNNIKIQDLTQEKQQNSKYISYINQRISQLKNPDDTKIKITKINNENEFIKQQLQNIKQMKQNIKNCI